MKLLKNQVFKLKQMSASPSLSLFFIVPYMIYIFRFLDGSFKNIFFLVYAPFFLVSIGFNHLITNHLEVTVDSIGFSLKVVKVGLFGSKVEINFAWESLQKFYEPNKYGITIDWVGSKSHYLSGADMEALYKYLQDAFPEREHKPWWLFVK